MCDTRCDPDPQTPGVPFAGSCLDGTGSGEIMPRSIWNGTITFGLTVVPIKVHSAVEDHGVHFHQVHAKDGARLKQVRICSKEGKEVPYKQVAKGYEVRGGEYVMLTQDEIDAAAGEQSHLIELEEFVAPRRSIRSSMTAPTISGRVRRARTPTVCFMTHWRAPSGSGSAAGHFTTASI
jgi:Ku70/Ku80 beta-barrel domain